MAAKPSNLFKSGVFVTLFTVSVTMICRFADFIPAVKASGKTIHAILFSSVLAAVYVLSLLTAKLFGAKMRTKRRLSVCALNTLVLSLPYIVYSSSFSASQAFGAALGASCAYVLATVIVHTGMLRLRENDTVPPAFVGNGALFIYVSILCLALSGIAGDRIGL